MKWIAHSQHPKPRRFVIEHQPPVGFYLFVFEGDRNTHDYLQDTLEIAMEQAEEDFGVARSTWQQIAD